MGWTETTSLSFTARHESSEADAVMAALEMLEAHRSRLEQLFPRMPTNVTVVLHDSSLQLALAHPHLPLARRLAHPAGRRYVAGSFTSEELHLLAPQALRRLAAGPESLRALTLTPERTYTQLVVGVNNELLPPPLRPSTLRGYLRLGWLSEGAAQFLSGQVPFLRAALARRLRGRTPSFPPSVRDAALLGGSVFDPLESERGEEACVELALSADSDTAERKLERAFHSPFADIRLRWRSHLERLASTPPAVTLPSGPAGR